MTIVPTQILTRSPYANEGFGYSVAIDGDYMVVGAPLATVSGRSNAGAAHIYHKNHTTGLWDFLQTLTPTDTQQNAQFGCSVAISSYNMAIGAKGKIVGGHTNVGEVYTYYLDSGTWHFNIPLFGSQTTDGSLFGNCLAMNDWNLLVGTEASGEAPGINGGVYYYDMGAESFNWYQEQHIYRSSPSFGTCVAIYGSRCAIGDNGTSTTTSQTATYTLGYRTWYLEQTFNYDAGTQAIALEGDRLIFGNFNMAYDIGFHNQVRLYLAAGDGWSFEYSWTPDPLYHRIGGSLAFLPFPGNNNYLFIGESGSYDYGHPGFLNLWKYYGGWTFRDSLTAGSDATSSQEFACGYYLSDYQPQVAISGNTIVVGALNPGASGLESVYVFEDIFGIPLPQQFVAPADGFIKGISVGLTYEITAGQMFIDIYVNGFWQATHVVNASFTSTSLSYEVALTNMVSLSTGDMVTCYVSTSLDYSSDPAQQIQLDLFMEFPSLPVVYEPPPHPNV